MTRYSSRVAPGSPPSNAPLHPVLWATVGLMAAIEFALFLGDEGVLPPLRWIAYSAFGFEDVTLEMALAGHGVTPKLVWSTVTYAFLHGGWLHLLLNSAALLGLGHAVSRDAGIRATAVIFLATAAAGALAFGLVADSRAPLVGASGAVFGLLGTVTAWQERWLAEHGASRQPIWGRVLGVVAINLIFAFGFMGMLVAWEAHLGGFAAGWLLGYVFPPAERARRLRSA
jgi:membrane associated rhomboid family serine protease